MPGVLPGVGAAGKVEYFLIAPIDGFRNSKIWGPTGFKRAFVKDDLVSLIHDLH